MKRTGRGSLKRYHFVNTSCEELSYMVSARKGVLSRGNSRLKGFEARVQGTARTLGFGEGRARRQGQGLHVEL